MHQFATRPAPLALPLPRVHKTLSIDRQTDAGNYQSQRNPVYLEASIRDGLPTPPADEMGTTYQPPQYNQYGSRPDVYSNQGSQGTYGGNSSLSRQYSVPHSSLNQLPPPLASTMRNDSQISSHPAYRVPSPVQSASQTNFTTFPRPAERPSSTGGDIISKSLQIPSSINNSGGSLAEFAAQVRNGCHYHINTS